MAAEVEYCARAGGHGNAVDPHYLVLRHTLVASDIAVRSPGTGPDQLNRNVVVDLRCAMERGRGNTGDDALPSGSQPGTRYSVSE
jgi:hypothetical protein